MNSLDAMGLSELQRGPVLDGRTPLLVAAGAGSGKTRMLVAYVVRALIEEGVQPEQLVAVTFTRKAASELVGRIRKALEDLGRADLARSLDRAPVGTIHGLCRRLIRERAVQTGTDPAATILEAEAASLVKQRLSREVWDKAAEAATEEHLGVLALGGDRLRRQIVPLYDRLRGMGYERPQVVVAPDSAGDTHAATGGSREEAALEVKDAIRAALGFAAECQSISATLRKDLDCLEACLEWLDSPLTIEERSLAIDDTRAFFPTKKTASMEPYLQPVRRALTAYRQSLAAVRLALLVDVANALLDEFHAAYEAHKLEKGLLDFADLELRAHRLASLSAGAGLAVLPPGSHLLIDEFQDTNPLQYSILNGLGASRQLMVGDERQSIYRFRGADVGVFRSRRAELDAPGEGETVGRVHRLDVNYRSRPEVLAFINRLFAHETFFGADFVALREPELESGAPRRPSTSGAAAVEAVVVQRPAESGDVPGAESVQEAEAQEVATRVRRLVDEEGWSQSDITILIPVQTHVDVYQRALTACGIDVYIVGGKGYYSQEEVSDVIALLRLLINPHDDFALVAALRSPLAGISDDALYLLGREGRRTRASLWEVVRNGGGTALRGDDAERLSVFTRRLLELRGRVGRPGLASLIDEAVSVCDYDLCLLGQVQGKRRFANVRKMMRMASEFEAVEGPDLAGFVDLLESMDDLSDREGSAPTLAEGEDVVRIMTVHQAKGLEFPVVLLAGLGTEVRTSDAAEFMVADDGRAGVFLRGSKRDNYEDADLSWGPAAEILQDERAKEREEDLRLLYVAMTRAEKRLVLIGAKPRAGGLDKCRIGRVLQALGCETMPEAGTEVPIAGLDAVILASPLVAGAERRQESREVGHAVVCNVSVPASTVDHPDPRFLRADPGEEGPRRMSFSSLAAYLRCPRRYYLERRLGLEFEAGRPPVTADSVNHDATDVDELDSASDLLLDEQERHSGQEIGLIVHALLERLPVGEGRPSEALLGQLAAAWVLETGSRLSDAQLQTAVRLARAFWDSPQASLRDATDSVREAPFLFAQGDAVVSGIMDLLSRGKDCWRIVDYKTNALNGRRPADVALDYHLQAVVYCLAALKSGAPAVCMDFVFLEQPAAPVTFEYSHEAVAELQQTLDEALVGLKRGRYAPAFGEQCATCAATEVCTNMVPGPPDGIQ